MTTDPPRVVGLDLSLTSSGVAVVCGTGIRLTRIQPAGQLGDHERIDWIRHRVWELAAQVDLAVVERTTYAQTTGKAHERAGLWWIITRMLWRQHLPYAVVESTKLKKYATGYGGGKNSGKDRVLAAAIKRYPMADVDGNDVADALILAAMGADHLGHPLAPVPQVQRAALTGVHWPVLRPAT